MEALTYDMDSYESRPYILCFIGRLSGFEDRLNYRPWILCAREWGLFPVDTERRLS